MLGNFGLSVTGLHHNLRRLTTSVFSLFVLLLANVSQAVISPFMGVPQANTPSYTSCGVHPSTGNPYGVHSDKTCPLGDAVLSTKSKRAYYIGSASCEPSPASVDVQYTTSRGKTRVKTLYCTATATTYTAPKLCPANATLTNTCTYPQGGCKTNFVCTCNAGFEDFNNVCVPVCEAGYYRDASGTCQFSAADSGPKNLGASDCQSQSSIQQGNPIHIGTGNKYQTQTIYRGPNAWLPELTLHYNSQAGTAGNVGANWQTNYATMITYVSRRNYSVNRPDGKVYRAHQSSSTKKWYVQSYGISADSISPVSIGWRYTNAVTNETEYYNGAGQLTSITALNGQTTTLSYDGLNRLVQVTSPTGKTLTFSYDADNRINQISNPAGEITALAYDSKNNLASITWPNGSVRQFLYENGTYINALTGIIAENGQRYATYVYDAQGRAISSEHANGADKITVEYQANGVAQVTDALGVNRSYKIKAIQQMLKVTSASQACGSCGGGVSTTTHDGNGNALSQTDFNGNVTQYTYDAYDRVIGRTEAASTPLARTTSTQWLATGIPLKIAHPYLITTYTYDSKYAVLTRKEQATTDATGALGFTAPVTGTARVWTYTNNANGQATQVDGPRTDVADITQYTYDADGNIATITDAIGRVTTLSYNVHGKLLSVQGPSGAVTNMTYDNRQRLVSSSQDGITSSFSYDANGNLTTTTRADGSQLNYQYDAANRLTGITDSLGNRIQYTLDAKGNILKQDTQDPSGTLTQTHQREFNTLNQLSKDITALGHATQYSYDSNGNLTQTTNPLGLSTTNVMDALNRTSQTTDTAGGITQYQYDANNRITKVIDPRNLETSYTYNGFGEVLSITSPDTGTSTRTYDTAGNQLTETDARGKTTAYSYDALNRLATSTDADNSTAQYSYDISGNIANITEPHTALSHTYTPTGRLLGKTQTIGTLNLNQSYSYNVAGQLQDYTYPSGAVLHYQYNANGQLQSITATVNGNTHTVADHIQYQPFGGITGHTNVANQTQHRQYDLDGRIKSYTQAGQTITLDYDAQSRITASTGTSQASTYAYDNLDRLTAHTDALLNQQHSYQYDANSNRTSKTSNAVTQLYSYPPTSHRLAQVDSRAYNYDAAGNTTSDGTQQFTYNAMGRMTTSTNSSGLTTTYQYNALGQRIKKQNTNATTHTAYDAQSHLIGEYDATGTANQETVWLYDTPIAVIKQHQLYAIHADHLDTPRLITDSTNQTTWAWPNNEAFGDNPANEDPNNTGNLFSYNLRFPGQLYDSETKTHYNYFRDSYAPDVGRYYQSDPIGLAGGINTFGYVEGNPVSNADPLGLVKHTTGKTISCGKCTIRIDFTFDEKTGVKTKHLHWSCKGKEGSCGEWGETSHGGSWNDAPENVKQCARENGFQGESPFSTNPTQSTPVETPPLPWWAPLLLPAAGAILSQ